MTTRSLTIAIVLGASLVASCGVSTSSGQCKDYTPVALCSDGYHEECERTDDGCEQCSCVPSKRGNDRRDPFR